MTSDTDGPALLRSVGLLPDGPGQWGRPIPAPGPGVFVIELAAPLPSAPIEMTRVGKWIERVDTLRLDRVRPTSKALAARLAAFWLPSQTVLYVGASDVSVRRRVAAMIATELGARRPYAGGYWLKTLHGLDAMRIWWAATSATEEYEDALLDAFAAGISDAERAGLADPDVVLPFANLGRGTGGRKSTGLTGALVVEPVEPPALPTRVVEIPDGDADGARVDPPTTGLGRRPTPSATRAAARATAPRAAGARSRATAATRPAPRSEALTVEGAARLRADLDQLIRVRRPEVIARIRTAKEHGDLSENAEYHAAREEQSFLEGRIQALEARMRTAPIVEAPAAGARVGLGSKVTVEGDGETVTYTIVGASESDPAAGRISSSSPVGRALVGHDLGDEVTVATPAGERRYRIVAIG